MTLKDIQKIIKDFESSELTELELEFNDVKLRLSKNKTTTSNLVLPNEQVLMNENNSNDNTSQIEPHINYPTKPIKSPLVGTFYLASSPDSEPFVSVGQKVKKGDVVCIIEAMKIMNEITATDDGIIEEIHFNSGQAVGYDDTLFTVKIDGTNTK